jgi:hypothetical protein
MDLFMYLIDQQSEYNVFHKLMSWHDVDFLT